MDPQNSSSSSSSNSSRSDGSSSNSNVCHRMLRPSVVLAVGSPVVLLVDIGLITVFLLRENWKGVILSSVAFIAWAQVIYWFFRTRSLIHARQQVRPVARDPEAASDAPPPYEEVIKTEAPPPSYYMVMPVGGWSSDTHGSSTHAISPKSSPPAKKSDPSGLGGHQEVAAADNRGGFTAPYLHHITRDEDSHNTATSSSPSDALVDPVQAIRAPIIGEVCDFVVPINAQDDSSQTHR